MADVLNLVRFLHVGRDVPIEGDAGGTVDQAVHDHFRAGRILPQRRHEVTAGQLASAITVVFPAFFCLLPSAQELPSGEVVEGRDMGGEAIGGQIAPCGQFPQQVFARQPGLVQHHRAESWGGVAGAADFLFFVFQMLPFQQPATGDLVHRLCGGIGEAVQVQALVGAVAQELAQATRKRLSVFRRKPPAPVRVAMRQWGVAQEKEAAGEFDLLLPTAR